RVLPGRFVPAVCDEYFAGGGGLGDVGEQIVAGVHLGEVEAGQVESGVGGVHVGVGEGGGDECALEVDDVGIRVQHVSGGVLADPGDGVVGDGHCCRACGTCCVNASTHQQRRVLLSHTVESARVVWCVFGGRTPTPIAKLFTTGNECDRIILRTFEDEAQIRLLTQNPRFNQPSPTSNRKTI